MNRVVVGPDIAKCTHHISLSDETKTLGFIISDSNGNSSPQNLSCIPIQTTAVKTTTGTQKYGDFVPPWSPIAQDDWSGGRGLEDFTEDSTRFFDSYRAQTGFGEIYNAPLEYYAKGLRKIITNYPGSVSWLKMKDGASKYIAVKFIPSASFSAGQLKILICRRGTPSEVMTVELCADSTGFPGAVLYTKTITTADITDTISEFKKISIGSVSLVSGTTYWIKVYSAESTEDDYWQIGIKQASGSTYQSSDNILWAASAFDLYYLVAEADQGYKPKFFTYKYLKFAIYQKDSGTPKLFVNGTIGVADSNSGQLNKIIDASKSWTVNFWAGAMVGIIGGLGYEEPSVYRKILSNDATSLTLDSPYTITQDTTTEYIIFSTDQWIEIPSGTHGLTGRVTDICVVNDIIYFAQGDSIFIRRMRWAVSGGTGGWVSENEEFKALYLTTLRHKDRGLEIWRAQNMDKNKAVSVSRATVIDWLGSSMTLLNQTTAITAETATAGVDFAQGDNTNLEYKMTVGTVGGTNHPYMVVQLQESDDNIVFTAAGTFQNADAAGTYYLSVHCTKRYRRCLINVYGTSPSFNNINIVSTTNLRFHEPVSFHDSFGKINQIIEYSENEVKNLWVMREGMVFTIKTDSEDSESDFADPISLPELSTVMEEHNGETSITSNVYLYFTIGNGIQRYYNQKLDSNGPDADAGLPSNRQGVVSSAQGYPGRYFASVDAGTSGYSSILMNNESGWHEIYRAPNIGERIFDMSFQAIPTEEPDRLWFSVGDDIAWLVMPSKTLKAVFDDNAEYTHESVVVSAWHSASMVDITKLWKSINIISENLEADSVFIEADYQIDQETEWHPLPAEFYINPSQEVQLRETFGVSGKRMRYRLRMQTIDKTKTPRIKTVVVKAIGRVDLKYAYSFPYRSIEDSVNLLGEPEDMTPEEVQDTVNEWAGGITKLLMHSTKKLFDNKWVYLNAVSFNAVKENEEGYVGTITATEI